MNITEKDLELMEQRNHELDQEGWIDYKAQEYEEIKLPEFKWHWSMLLGGLL